MKKKVAFILAICFGQITFSSLNAQPNPYIYKNWEEGFTMSLKNTHDLALPQWGPYSDKYNGISHVRNRF